MNCSTRISAAVKAAPEMPARDTDLNRASVSSSRSPARESASSGVMAAFASRMSRRARAASPRRRAARAWNSGPQTASHGPTPWMVTVRRRAVASVAAASGSCLMAMKQRLGGEAVGRGDHAVQVVLLDEPGRFGDQLRAAGVVGGRDRHQPLPRQGVGLHERDAEGAGELLGLDQVRRPLHRPPEQREADPADERGGGAEPGVDR